MQLDIHFIAHFNQQSQIVVGAKPGIQTETSKDRLYILGIVVLKLLQALAQGGFLFQMRF